LFKLLFGGLSRVVVNLSVVQWGTSFYTRFYIRLLVLSEGGIMLGIACILFQSFLHADIFKK